jgi:nucleotide-binding universal stress UspA family protein
MTFTALTDDSPQDQKIESVLLATDLSEAAQKPLQHAIGIARHYGAKLYLAHVVSSLGFTLPGGNALDTATEAARRNAHQLETQLVEAGVLAGLDHEFIVTQGVVWQVLNQIIREKEADLIVSGARGSGGLRKLLLGSVAEQIFRYADCMVYTVGPASYHEARADEIVPNRTFLFATDFTEASLHALPYAVSYANQFGAKLVLLHVLPTAPNLKSLLYTAAMEALEDVSRKDTLKVKPECVVEFCPSGPISKKILETAKRLEVDLIIMGLRRAKHVQASSHAPWAMAYEVVCGAGCPVATTRW